MTPRFFMHETANMEQKVELCWLLAKPKSLYSAPFLTQNHNGIFKIMLDLKCWFVFFFCFAFIQMAFLLLYLSSLLGLAAMAVFGPFLLNSSTATLTSLYESQYRASSQFKDIYFIPHYNHYLLLTFGGGTMLGTYPAD